METRAILALAALTSLLAYGWGAWRRGLPPGRLPRAAGQMLEGVGASLVFLGLNLAVAAAVVVALRLRGTFASFYALEDPSILVLALLQGLAYQAWRENR